MATGSTAIYKIPYPLPTDQVDVAGDFEQLAVKIEDNLQEWVQDISSTMITGGTYSNGINTPIYNDTTGTISMTLSQDLRSTANPTFNNLNLSGNIFLTGSILTPSVIDVTSSTEALRITQRGTGNAFLVEDSTNLDASPFVIDSSGKTISGYTSAIDTRYDTTIVTPRSQILSPDSDNLLLANHSSNDLPATLYGAKSRSTDPAIKVSVVSGDSLLRLSAAGDDGTLFTEAARIDFEVDGIPETNSMPGRIVFSTTIDTSNTPTERMRISNTGYVGIGKTSPTSPLDVFGTITGSSGLFGNLLGTTGTVSTFNATSITSPTILTSTPTSSNQVATKSYVDNLTGSLAPEILQFDDIRNSFDGQTNRFYLTNNKNGTKIFHRTNLVYDPSFEGVQTVKLNKYNIGDLGPAGGTVFITPTTAGNNTGKYFETAPANVDGSTNITSSVFKQYVIPGADSPIIGSGLQNTLDIIQATTYNTGEMRTFTNSSDGIAANVVDGQGIYWTKPSGFTQDEVDQFNSMNGKSVNAVYLEDYSRKNLVPNPSFEVNVSSYQSNYLSSLSRSTEQSYLGSASVLCTMTTTNQFRLFPYPFIPIRVGITYTASAYVRDFDSNLQYQMVIQWVNALGNPISGGGSTIYGSATSVSSLGWTRITVTATAPNPAVSASIFVTPVTNNVEGAKVYVDNFLFEESDTAKSYFDGSNTDQVNGYDSISWIGTANNSTSIMSAYRTTASKSFSITPVITARSAYGSYPSTNAMVAVGDTVLFTSTSTSDFTPTSITDGFRIPSCKFMWQGTQIADINAANLARAYALNGYSDWHLPSKNELQQLYSTISYTRNTYPGINYWSTSTFDDNFNLLQAYNFGYPYEEYTTQNYFVRPVRSFFADPVNFSPSHSIERIGERWTTNPTTISNTGSTITRTYADKYIGNSCMKVVTDGESPYQGVSYNLGALLPNSPYTISAYVKAISGRPINIVAQDTYNVITTSSLSTSSGDWTRLSVTIVTGIEKANVIFALITDITLGASEFYVDAVMCEQTDQLQDYFDGNNKPASAGRIISDPSWIDSKNDSPSTVKYYESGEFKITNPQRVELSIYGIIQTVSYPEYVWQSMIPQDGFMVDSDGYVTFSEAPTRGSTFNAKYIAGNNTVAETNKKKYPFRPIDILLGS